MDFNQCLICKNNLFQPGHTFTIKTYLTTPKVPESGRFRVHDEFHEGLFTDCLWLTVRLHKIESEPQKGLIGGYTVFVPASKTIIFGYHFIQSNNRFLFCTDQGIICEFLGQRVEILEKPSLILKSLSMV